MYFIKNSCSSIILILIVSLAGTNIHLAQTKDVKTEDKYHDYSIFKETLA